MHGLISNHKFLINLWKVDKSLTLITLMSHISSRFYGNPVDIIISNRSYAYKDINL